MMLPLYAVYGASGFGREVMPLAREQLAGAGIASDRLVFVDDNPATLEINGQTILRYSEFLATMASERYAVLAIGDGVVREHLAARCAIDGVKTWTVRAANVVVMDNVEIGLGGIICPFVTLTSNIRIGNYFHANIYSYVAHDCIIGNFVTFAPGVKCNGNIVVEDQVYIGTGAVIKQGKAGQPIVIGKGAVIGMGAVVTKDVLPGAVVIGNPAKPMKRV